MQALEHRMISVRPAIPADSTAWLRMRAALWPEAPAPELAQEMEEFFEGRSRFITAVLVASDIAGTPVGFAELSIRSVVDSCETDRVAYLEGWYVDPHARRHGVGRALIAAAEAWGRAQGCTEFGSDTQITNMDSAAAHVALGFTEVEQLRCFRKLI
jgi:aminoglycoside 6'-N-acetyltransferase I